MKRAINLPAAKALVHKLAKQFGVSAPYLALRHGSARRDIYRYSTRTIYLQVSHSVWDVDNSLLHEFAHHLVRMRSKPKLHHGPEFKAALLAVVHAHYGNEIDRYQWTREYDSIRPLRDVAANRVAMASAREEAS